MNSLNKVIGDGCNINRDIKQLVLDQFEKLTVEQFYAPKLPKIGGYLYKGIATKCERSLHSINEDAEMMGSRGETP